MCVMSYLLTPYSLTSPSSSPSTASSPGLTSSSTFTFRSFFLIVLQPSPSSTADAGWAACVSLDAFFSFFLRFLAAF